MAQNPSATNRPRSGGQRPSSSKASGPSRSAAAATARARLAAERARQEQRRRRLFLVAIPLAVVLIAVGALVAVRFLGGRSATPSANGPAESGVVSAVTSVPAGVLDAVGVGSVTSPPKPLNGPPLTDGGKPKVLYVGAEYCPFCAAERWSMVVALSRFGTFSGLGQTASSARDQFPSTPTLSFHGSSFTSSTITFTGVETESNQVAGNSYAPLDTLTAADQQTLDTYNAPPYVDASSAGAIPFVDIGGKYLISGASYSPQLLAGLTHQQVADALKDPNSDIAKAADGTANLITAAICASTSQQPAGVCTSAGVQAAAKVLG